MTPKEKAEYFFIINYQYKNINNTLAKKLAIQLVDEIIKAMKFEGLTGGYFEEVKQEIEKL